MISFILRLLLAGVASLSGAQAQNSLTNTAWQGQAKVPDEATIILHFKTDTVYMYIYPDMYLGETMVYTAKADTLTLKKTSGNSPCDTQGVGTLQFVLKNEALMPKPITDDCRDRKAAWIDKPLKKVAIPVR